MNINRLRLRPPVWRRLVKASAPLFLLSLLCVPATGGDTVQREPIILYRGPAPIGYLDLSPDRHTAYLITEQGGGADSAGQIRLQIYEVVNPLAPREEGSVVLGGVWVIDLILRPGVLVVEAGIGTRGSTNGNLTFAIDITNPQSPKISSTFQSQINATLLVSADGSCVAVGNQTERLINGVFVAEKCSVPEDSGSIRPQIYAGTHWINPIDSYQGSMLAFGDTGLELWAVTPGEAPKRIRGLSDAGERSFGGAKFLADPSMMLTTEWSKKDPKQWQLEILTIPNPSFDWGNLVAVHAALLAEYEKRRSAQQDTPSAIYDNLSQRLEDAGARKLMEDPSDASRVGQAAQILNDWGFWLSKGSDPGTSVLVLQKVVALKPDRAVAWRNLGDAARASLSGATPDTERTRLTQLAVQAYSTYRKLTGSYESGMEDFIGWNALNTPPDDVCGFVAGYYTRGRQREIIGVPQPVDPDGSGRKLNLSVEYGGSLLIPYVKATTDNGEEVDSEAAFGLGDFGPNNIRLVPFGRAVYAVTEKDGAPLALNDWDGQQRCKFAARYKALIKESRDDAACRDLLAGSLAPVQATTEADGPVPITIETNDGGSFWADMNGEGIAAVLDIDLSGSGRTDHVGSFTGYRPHGDCHTAGVVLLDGNQPQAGPRNAALLNAQMDLVDCDSARAFVVRHQNHPYVEIDSGLLRRNEVQSRTLLRVTATGVETVCRIVGHPTYTGTAMAQGKSTKANP